MTRKMKESYSTNDDQSWLPLKLSYRLIIFILIFVGLANLSMSAEPCDPNVSFQPYPDYNISVLHLTSTSVRIKWTNPPIIQRIYPDYYCIVYNAKSIRAVLLPRNNRTFQFEIKNLTPNIFYNINVKPCVNGECSFMKSFTRRVHT